MAFFITHSGKRIDIENISEDDICLDDISHHLTKICRYGGTLDLETHYSVANHSIALFYYALDNNLPLEVQRNILMHDAAEAYLGDIVNGVKMLLPDYKVLEAKVEELITNKYNLSTDDYFLKVVKNLDTCILLDEVRSFLPQYYADFKEQLPDHKELGITLYSEGRASNVTRSLFLHCCDMVDIYD